MRTKGAVQAVNINDLKRYSADARVNQPLLASNDFVTRMSCYEPGQVTPTHMHPNDDEIVFCVEGRGAITRDAVPISPGSLVTLPAGLAHGIEAATDCRMVVIYMTNAGYTSVRAIRTRRPPRSAFRGAAQAVAADQGGRHGGIGEGAGNRPCPA